MLDIDVDAALGTSVAPEAGETACPSVFKTKSRHFQRKATSDAMLEESLDWYLEPGDCYHCFSWGDVDVQSYVKHVLRQQRIEYLAISTWCMAIGDVENFTRWHAAGAIGRIDFFVGEIFRGSYPEAYAAAHELAIGSGGRLVVFRNHAKIAVMLGERFDCLIESSSNFNMNPRCENTVLTVDTDLARAYSDLLASINPFNADCGAGPYDWRVDYERG